MLTPKQRETILNVKYIDDEYITNGHHKVFINLINKGYAEYTEGFGFKFGWIIKLTKKGIKAYYKMKLIRDKGIHTDNHSLVRVQIGNKVWWNLNYNFDGKNTFEGDKVFKKMKDALKAWESII